MCESLEEAEYLSEKVCILHRGQLKADGSVAFLKKSLGKAFEIVLMSRGESSDSLEEFTKRRLPGCEIISSAAGRLQVWGWDGDRDGDGDGDEDRDGDGDEDRDGDGDGDGDEDRDGDGDEDRDGDGDGDGDEDRDGDGDEDRDGDGHGLIILM